ncbi:MAG TPA: glycosyltransferase [Vicinamibacterales bacterium]|nr:glycosyltransferase [Vicinamibacterales bacterium]
MTEGRKLRVCHVMSADLWAGAEVQVASTVAYLVGDPGISLMVVLLNDGPLARELRRLGVSVTVVDESRTSALAILFFLIGFLKRNEIELVHTHRYKDTVLGFIAARFAGVPHAVRTIHGLREPMKGWDRVKFGVYEALERVALHRWADLVIAVSKHIADDLTGAGYPPAIVTHIHNGVDLRALARTRRRDEVRHDLGIDPTALVIGTAGRLVPVKGHASLLRAAGLILQKERRAKFLIVGDGPLRGELTALAVDLGIDGACQFLGHRADVHDLVSAMDIFVLPSLAEGIPMAVLEAMALGSPVVATAVGGVPEVVGHRASGLLVESGEHAIADACLELAHDRDLAGRLAAEGRRVVEDRFSNVRSGEALVRAYERVALEERRPPHTRGLVRRLARSLLNYASRRVAHAVGRQRMNRIRRNPELLTRAAQSARNLLIVCHGNIIRSPFAAQLLAKTLGDWRPRAIGSAGLEAVPGRPPHPTALVTATSHSVDLSRHTASPVTPERVAASDLIFVMDVPQLVTIQRRYPDARRKTFLLTCLAPEVPLEIHDPVDGDESMFKACFDHIARAASPLARALAAEGAAR